MSDKIGNIDAASLIAVPAHYSKTDMNGAITTAGNQCRDMLKDEALLSHIWQTKYGNLGAIFIPVVDFNLFKDKEKTLSAVLKGIELAGRHGAKSVSFTGMIPAATRYAIDIVDSVKERAIINPLIKNIRLTTGHAAVVAAFALNIDRILKENDRTYNEESVAFVGLGSIGSGILKLMTSQPCPKHMYFVDVEKKAGRIHELKNWVREKYGPQANISVILVKENEGVPKELYRDTTLFLSASSAANIIDVQKFKPNTLLVDDSFPLGFDTNLALDRINSNDDIMITIAGGFEGPSNFELLYNQKYPDNAEYQELLTGFERVANPWTNCMTGCIYSSLITPFYGLPDTIGPVQLKEAQLFYDTLKSNGFLGTPPYFITVGIEKGKFIYSY